MRILYFPMCKQETIIDLSVRFQDKSIWRYHMKTEQQTPHWIPCPICKEKTDVKIYDDTTLLYFPLYCPHCKRETLVHVVQLKM